MPQHIQGHTLLVISDTMVFEDATGTYAFEPVLRELNVVSELFDKIIWLGSIMSAKTNVLARVDNPRIQIVALPDLRHQHANALYAALAYPSIYFKIRRYLREATHVHTRGPSHPALLGIFMSSRDSKRSYWHKYAGNWMTDHLPFTYKLQKDLLQKLSGDNIRITVNGDSSADNATILSFANPCLSEDERIDAGKVATVKDFSGLLSLLYVGALHEKKGIPELLSALESDALSRRYHEIYIAGDGQLHSEIAKRATAVSNIKIHLTGQLNRESLNKLYAQCHVLVLPSHSEGFPKVIAEAAAYGCISVVTDISSISQYVVDKQSGFLMSAPSPEEIVHALNDVAGTNDLKLISEQARGMCVKFTYEYFKTRVSQEIFPAVG